MKRVICFILCLIFMVASMSGCQKEKEADSGECLAPYLAFDMETLFEDLAGAYYADVEDSQVETEEYLLTYDVGTEEKPFLVPIMNSDQYIFYDFEAFPSWYRYRYAHVDAPPVNSLEHSKFELYLEFYKNQSFSGIEEDEQVVMLSSNTARYKDENWWYFESVGGGLLVVRFPDSIVIESPDDVWDYFSFEQYVVDDEGVHKLSGIIDGDDYP